MMPSGRFTFTAMGEVTYGLSAAQVIVSKAEELGATRVFLLVSSTLKIETNEIDKVIIALGDRYAGLYASIPAHTPR